MTTVNVDGLAFVAQRSDLPPLEEFLLSAKFQLPHVLEPLSYSGGISIQRPSRASSACLLSAVFSP